MGKQWKQWETLFWGAPLMGPDAMFLVFIMLSFKPTFSLSSLTFIKRFFSFSSLSAIRAVSSAYLRLLIFLTAILIPACVTPRQSLICFLFLYILLIMDISYKWNHIICSLLCFLQITNYFQDSFTLSHVQVLHSFLWLNNIPLYAQLILIAYRFCICKFSYLLKFICKPPINTCSVFVTIHRHAHAQSVENF